jgi:hypothetical protein
MQRSRHLIEHVVSGFFQQRLGVSDRSLVANILMRASALQTFAVSPGQWSGIVEAVFPPLMLTPCIWSFEMLVALTADTGLIHLGILSSMLLTVMPGRVPALVAPSKFRTALVADCVVPLGCCVCLLALRSRRTYGFRRHGRRVKRVCMNCRLVVMIGYVGRCVVHFGFVVRSIGGRDAVDREVMRQVKLLNS